MRKVLYILKEMLHMIRRHKFYFIAPILIILALLAILVYYLGPAAIVSFFYAGV